MALLKPVEQLYRVFEAVNKKNFGNQLPTPAITIQSRGKKLGVLGWCSVHEIWQGENQGFREINICAEALNRPPIEIVETIIHETAHYVNLLNGIKDCTKNQYHNKKFKKAAEALGLEVMQDKKFGYAFTSMGPKALKFFQGLKIPEDAFPVSRVQEGVTKKEGSKSKKWTCGCTKVSSSMELEIKCLKCGKEFKEIEKEEKEDAASDN